MITVLHLITDLEIGGAEMMLTKLLQSMDPTRYCNSVVTLTGRGVLADQLEAAGVPVYSLMMRRSRVDLMALPKLVKLIRAIRPTVVQTWLYHADLIGTVAVKLSYGPKLLWNVRCSNMDMAHYPWTSRAILKMLALSSRIPSEIIVNSEAGQRLHHEIGYRPRRWRVIPNGFNVEEFRPDYGAYVMWRDKLGLAHDTVLIGMVARKDPMKDHATFLAAARQLVKKRRDVSFLLVGKGVEELAPEIESLGLADKVHLLGVRKDIAAILSALDIFTLTSSFGEGFPNVVGEAMACGVPCVVTNIGDSSLVVGETGRVVPARNPEALVKEWLDLIGMTREERARLGESSRERIKTCYGLHSVAREYERCYEEIAS